MSESLRLALLGAGQLGGSFALALREGGGRGEHSGGGRAGVAKPFPERDHVEALSLGACGRWRKKAHTRGGVLFLRFVTIKGLANNEAARLCDPNPLFFTMARRKCHAQPLVLDFTPFNSAY